MNINKLSLLHPLFNDLRTADIIIRVDNTHFHAHTCVLYVTTGFWNRYLKLRRSALLNGNEKPIDNGETPRERMLKHDCSCSKTKSIAGLCHYKGDTETELKYTFEDFGVFLKYLYGYPMEGMNENKLFVLAYLASKKKFDVPELVSLCDQLLYETWENRRWRITLRASKWLGLNKLRCQVLKYLYTKGDSMFAKHVVKELDEHDWKIMSIVSDQEDPCRMDFDEICERECEYVSDGLEDVQGEDGHDADGETVENGRMVGVEEEIDRVRPQSERVEDGETEWMEEEVQQDGVIDKMMVDEETVGIIEVRQDGVVDDDDRSDGMDDVWQDEKIDGHDLDRKMVENGEPVGVGVVQLETIDGEITESDLTTARDDGQSPIENFEDGNDKQS
ncbi:4764_t:CDS:2 [Acaulospora colombiana]|uniref:4764_t:CDS:1 n=1 Tax=Acaulospora colombiana TaxID=27376 RepID=A0ACA9LCX3_9GLOM|nr:4764_t:CDS:2 [Acaulospora colombiana]